GGSSAGAFTALHLAYMNEFSEVPSFIDTTLMGNLEGESGNPGYSSDINAVINLCGALGAKETIIPGDIPFVSMHGTNDNTVPYATDTITLLGLFPIMLVDGSYSSNAYASTIGVHNEMYTYYGAGHVPYLGDSAYMDTTVRFVSNFLYDYLSCTPRDLNPLPNTFGITGISDADELTNSISVYPNPATDYIIVESESEIIGYKIFDVSGRLVRSAESTHKSKIRIERHQLKPGYYTLSILTKTGEVPKQIYFGF
ncbi:MAG: T9SS type A sorting domain-containing protein, partial [Bacteroidia bacterium]|nr:T9SS type A sorting domain-containing protein [Bacteroidia bacterium]